MFDIGLGEIILLALVGLLVFGPERLPRAAADAGRWARQIRTMAASANPTSQIPPASTSTIRGSKKR